MTTAQGITQELSFGDVVSKTFEFYRRDFVKYVILFAVVEAIIGVATTLVRQAVSLPTLPADATAQQVADWAPGFFGSVAELVGLIGIVTLVFYPIAYGGAVRMASGEIEKGSADLGASVRYAVSRLVWIWIVGLVVGIIVLLGFIALVVPGIILALMFSLVLPVIMIEKADFASLGRSRKLVSGRWLKTLGLFIVFAIIVGISSAVAGAISAPFGVGSTVVSSILSAFYLPLVPILLTVYYYSNVARISPPQVSQATPMAPAPVVQEGMKFCPSCGTQLPATAMFCPSCGAKQPV